MREALRWVILCALAAAPAAEARTLAVVPFGEAASEVEPALRSALGRITGVRLSTSANTAADVEAARQVGLACGPQSDECLVKLALFLRVDQLVSLAATRTAEGLALELILIDAALGRRAGEVTLTLDPERRAEQLVDAALLLLVPDQAFGVVALELAPGDASVRIDGELTPASAPLRLRAGEHTIEVSRDGFESERHLVAIRPASSVTLRVRLTPVRVVEIEPPQPAPPAGPSPLVIGGAAVAGVGALALLGGGATAVVLDAVLGTPQGTAEDRAQLLSWERVAAGAAVAGAVGLAAGGALMLVAD